MGRSTFDSSADTNGRSEFRMLQLENLATASWLGAFERASLRARTHDMDERRQSRPLDPIVSHLISFYPSISLDDVSSAVRRELLPHVDLP
jgi:hypothetical protein